MLCKCYYYRGIAYRRQGDNVQAIDDLSKAVLLNQRVEHSSRVIGEREGIGFELMFLTNQLEVHQLADLYYERSLSYRVECEIAKADADLAAAQELGYKAQAAARHRVIDSREGVWGGLGVESQTD